MLSLSDLSLRLVGLALVMPAVQTTVVHKAIWETAKSGAPTAAELGISLTTFFLASAGLLLIVHGRKLFDQSE